MECIGKGKVQGKYLYIYIYIKMGQLPKRFVVSTYQNITDIPKISFLYSFFLSFSFFFYFFLSYLHISLFIVLETKFSTQQVNLPSSLQPSILFFSQQTPDPDHPFFSIMKTFYPSLAVFAIYFSNTILAAPTMETVNGLEELGESLLVIFFFFGHLFALPPPPHHTHKKTTREIS